MLPRSGEGELSFRGAAPPRHDRLADALYRAGGSDLPCISVAPPGEQVERHWDYLDWGLAGDAAFKAIAAAALRETHGIPTQRDVDNHAAHLAGLVQDHLRPE